MVIEKLKELPPLERIKALQKIKEKTMKDLEKITEKTDKEIKKSLEDIAREEESKIQKNEKEEQHQKLIKKVINPILEKDLYEITQSEFYNTLKEARNKAAKGELSSREVQELNKVKTEFETIVENKTYEGNDPKHYAQRSQELLNQIESYSSRLEEMSDYKIAK
jgi:hypothetical protein